MKSTFGQIIHHGDLDFAIIGKYLFKYWYIWVLTSIVGVGFGLKQAQHDQTTYTMISIIKSPESWAYVEDYSPSVLFNFAKQFSKAYPDYKIDIEWVTMLKDSKGTEIYALVQASRTSVTPTQATEVFGKFLQDLSASPQVTQMNQRAGEAMAKKVSLLQQDLLTLPVTLHMYQKLAPTEKEKDTLALSAFEKATSIEQEINRLNTTESQIGHLQWLTEPSPSNINKSKPWYFFVIAFGSLGALFGAFLTLIPGFIHFGNEQRK